MVLKPGASSPETLLFDLLVADNPKPMTEDEAYTNRRSAI
jgi:hypothetical protein